MRIELLKISSVDLPHHPSYVACDLAQVEKVCELLGTTVTVWSQDQVDILGRMAARGECDMHTFGSRVSIIWPTHQG